MVVSKWQNNLIETRLNGISFHSMVSCLKVYSKTKSKYEEYQSNEISGYRACLAVGCPVESDKMEGYTPRRAMDGQWISNQPSVPAYPPGRWKNSTDLGTGMNTFFTQIRQRWRDMDVPDRLMAAGAAALFLPYELLCALGVVLVIWLLWQRELVTCIKDLPGAPLLYASALFSTLGSINYRNGVGLLNSAGMFLVITLAAIYCRYITPYRFRLCLKVCSLMSLVAAGVALIELSIKIRLHGITLWECLTLSPEGCRVAAMFLNPNLYATMLVFFIISTAYLFLVSETNWKRFLYLGIAIVNLIMIFLTGCRAALLPLPFIIPLFLYFHHKSGMFALCSGIEGLMVLGIAAFPECIPRIEQMESITARFKIWNLALDHLKDRPWLGGGPQSYGKLYQEYGGMPAPHAHNVLIDSLLSGGIIGTSLRTFWLIGRLQECLEASAMRKMPLYFPFVLSMLITATVFGLVDCTLNFPPTALFFLAGLCSARPLSRQ